MKKIKKILEKSGKQKFIFLFAILIYFSFFNATAQIKKIGSPFITNYIPQSYGAGIQSWDAVQDNRGIMYFANNAGILEFDGNTWKIVYLPKEANVSKLEKSSNGTIYAYGANEFGYIISDSIGQTTFKSLNYMSPNSEVFDITVLGNKLYVLTKNEILIIDSSHKYVEKIQITNSKYGLITSANNEIYLIGYKEFAKFVNKKVEKIDIPQDFQNITSICKFDDNSVLITTRNGRTFTLSDTNISELTTISEILKDKHIYSSSNIKNQYFIVNTVRSGSFIFDANQNLIQHISKRNGLHNNTVLNSFVDNQNNLWLTTGSSVSLVEIFSPFTILDRQFGFESFTSTSTSLVDNKTFLGTGTGLICFDISEIENRKKIKNYTSIEGINEQVWKVIKLQGKIFSCSNSGISEIRENQAIPTKMWNNYNVWKILPTSNPEKYLALTNFGIYNLTMKNGRILDYSKIQGIDFDCRYMETNGKDEFFVPESGKGVYKITFDKNFENIKQKELLNSKDKTLKNKRLQLFNVGNKIIIQTFSKIYYYNENNNTIECFCEANDLLNSDKEILLIGADLQNNLYIEKASEQIYKLTLMPDGKYELDAEKFRKLIGFNIFNEIVNINQNSILVSTGDGIVHYDNKTAYNRPKNFLALIRKVEYLNSDSIVFGGIFYKNEANHFSTVQPNNQIERIKHENNSLRFCFSSTFYQDADKNQYQFMLSGFDEKWSKWTTETKKEYTNIPPGKYEFMLRTKNINGDESIISFYRFVILPPWYRTIYAYIVYFLLAVLFVGSLIKFATYRTTRRNQILEEKVEERTKELKLKNVELEQQKEEIQTQTEELEIINNELEKLSIVASETDNAVIITDKKGDFAWVNDAFVRMFGYTLEELISEVSPNIISENTDLKVKQSIQKCFEKKVPVEYELRTKTKNGNTIWVHTTLTPILDEFDEIRLLVAIDSDITKLKLAEKRILLQNQKIKGSIRYARTIQKSILPTNQDVSKYFENFIIYLPKDIVSGDFYWMSNRQAFFDKEIAQKTKQPIKYSGEKIGTYLFFAVVDCTGHGVPGAFMSLIGSRLLSEIINERKIHETDKILTYLDKGVKDVLKQNQNDSRDGMDLSICRIKKIAVEDEIKYEICYSGAKLPITYYSQKQNKLVKTKPTRRTIGGQMKINPDFEATKIFLEKNDIIYMYSDGMKDQNNPQRKKLGTSKINRNIMKNCQLPMIDQRAEMLILLKSWKNKEEQRDDITFVGLKM